MSHFQFTEFTITAHIIFIPRQSQRMVRAERASARETLVGWYGSRGKPVYWAGGAAVAGRGVAALCRFVALMRPPPREHPSGHSSSIMPPATAASDGTLQQRMQRVRHMAASIASR